MAEWYKCTEITRVGMCTRGDENKAKDIYK